MNKSKTPDTLSVKNVFLTIPHFDKLEETFQTLELQSKELLIDKIAVVSETHTADVNKGSHLHVFVTFTKRREIGLKFFDFLGKHGKLERIRSIEAVLQYMNKENICKTNFDVWEVLLEKNFTRTIVRMHEAGWNQDEILLGYATKLSGNKPWNAAFNLALKHEAATIDRETKFSLVRIRTITPELISNRLTPEEQKLFYAIPEFSKLIDVVNKLLKYGNMHPYKECCVSIIGKPSIGKSTFVRALSEHFVTYNFPMDGWHTKYTNKINELVVWHEWDIKLISRSDLLLFTEGEIVDLKVKYTKAVKKDRPLILLTSNETFETKVRQKYAYDKQQRDVVLAALNVRILELDFGTTNIWFLTKLFVPTVDDIPNNFSPQN